MRTAQSTTDNPQVKGADLAGLRGRLKVILAAPLTPQEQWDAVAQLALGAYDDAPNTADGLLAARRAEWLCWQALKTVVRRAA